MTSHARDYDYDDDGRDGGYDDNAEHYGVEKKFPNGKRANAPTIDKRRQQQQHQQHQDQHHHPKLQPLQQRRVSQASRRSSNPMPSQPHHHQDDPQSRPKSDVLVHPVSALAGPTPGDISAYRALRKVPHENIPHRELFAPIVNLTTESGKTIGASIFVRENGGLYSEGRPGRLSRLDSVIPIGKGGWGMVPCYANDDSLTACHFVKITVANPGATNKPSAVLATASQVAALDAMRIKGAAVANYYLWRRPKSIGGGGYVDLGAACESLRVLCEGLAERVRDNAITIRTLKAALSAANKRASAATDEIAHMWQRIERLESKAVVVEGVSDDAAAVIRVVPPAENAPDGSTSAIVFSLEPKSGTDDRGAHFPIFLPKEDEEDTADANGNEKEERGKNIGHENATSIDNAAVKDRNSGSGGVLGINVDRHGRSASATSLYKPTVGSLLTETDVQKIIAAQYRLKLPACDSDGLVVLEPNGVLDATDPSFLSSSSIPLSSSSLQLAFREQASQLPSWNESNSFLSDSGSELSASLAGSPTLANSTSWISNAASFWVMNPTAFSEIDNDADFGADVGINFGDTLGSDSIAQHATLPDQSDHQNLGHHHCHHQQHHHHQQRQQEQEQQGYYHQDGNDYDNDHDYDHDTHVSLQHPHIHNRPHHNNDDNVNDDQLDTATTHANNATPLYKEPLEVGVGMGMELGVGLGAKVGTREGAIYGTESKIEIESGVETRVYGALIADHAATNANDEFTRHRVGGSHNNESGYNNGNSNGNDNGNGNGYYNFNDGQYGENTAANNNDNDNDDSFCYKNSNDHRHVDGTIDSFHHPDNVYASDATAMEGEERHTSRIDGNNTDAARFGDIETSCQDNSDHFDVPHVAINVAHSGMEESRNDLGKENEKSAARDASGDVVATTTLIAADHHLDGDAFDVHPNANTDRTSTNVTISAHIDGVDDSSNADSSSTSTSSGFVNNSSTNAAIDAPAADVIVTNANTDANADVDVDSHKSSLEYSNPKIGSVKTKKRSSDAVTAKRTDQNKNGNASASTDKPSSANTIAIDDKHKDGNDGGDNDGDDNDTKTASTANAVSGAAATAHSADVSRSETHVEDKLDSDTVLPNHRAKTSSSSRSRKNTTKTPALATTSETPTPTAPTTTSSLLPPSDEGESNAAVETRRELSLRSDNRAAFDISGNSAPKRSSRASSSSSSSSSSKKSSRRS